MKIKNWSIINNIKNNTIKTRKGTFSLNGKNSKIEYAWRNRYGKILMINYIPNENGNDYELSFLTSKGLYGTGLFKNKAKAYEKAILYMKSNSS